MGVGGSRFEGQVGPPGGPATTNSLLSDSARDIPPNLTEVEIPLRKTVPVDFNHHSHRAGRFAFRKWAMGIDDPNFSAEPVFRYGRSFSEALNELRVLAASQPDIFLCNIVEHSSALTSRSEFKRTDDLAFDYADIDALIDAPNVTGYLVNDDLLSGAMMPLRGWSAICGEHSFDESCREAGLVEFALLPAKAKENYSEGTLHCHLANPAQFATNWRNISFPIYFIPPSISFDFPVTADRFQRHRLRSHLLRRKTPFATLGECHMDDNIAVAYLQPSLDFPEAQRCFIR